MPCKTLLCLLTLMILIGCKSAEDIEVPDTWMCKCELKDGGEKHVYVFLVEGRGCCTFPAIESHTGYYERWIEIEQRGPDVSWHGRRDTIFQMDPVEAQQAICGNDNNVIHTGNLSEHPRFGKRYYPEFMSADERD